VIAGDVDGDWTSISSWARVLVPDPVLHQRRKGNFTAGAPEKPSLMPAFFQLADVDGDSKLDLISARQETGLLGVFWNDAGRIDTVTDIPGRATPVFLTAVDIEGDGDLDVIGGIFDGFTIAVQETPRRFRIVEIIAPIQFPFGFTARDLDGDGDADLAAPSFTINGKPALALLRNHGDVGFDPPVLRLVPFFLGPISSADYDGDRRPSLVASAQPFCVDGNCVFEPRLATFLNQHSHISRRQREPPPR
jgi:hypothetical protein